MKTTSHLKSTITLSARGAMRCPPLGRVFLFVAHLLACVALAPVTQACSTPPDAWATYVASYSFTANWSSGEREFRQPVISWMCPRAVRLVPTSQAIKT